MSVAYRSDSTPAQNDLVKIPSSGNIALIAVGCVMTAIMLTITSLRFYVKFYMQRRHSPDDWTILVAAISAFGYFLNFLIATLRGKLGVRTSEMSLTQSTTSETVLITLKVSYIATWFTFIVWPFAKTSFLLMYLQLFKPLKTLRYAIYIGLGVTWVFYLATTIAMLVFTVPRRGETWNQSFASKHFLRALDIAIPMTAGSLVLDVYIFLLPIAPILRLHMTPKKKLGVLAVFATGLSACVASGLHIYFMASMVKHQVDFSYYLMREILMALVEMCVGISASCMPPLAYLFRHGDFTWVCKICCFRNSFRRMPSPKHKQTPDNSVFTGGVYHSQSWNEDSNAITESGVEEHELTHSRSIQTFIRSGTSTPSQRGEHGIHLKYRISQDVEFLPGIPSERIVL